MFSSALKDHRTTVFIEKETNYFLYHTGDKTWISYAYAELKQQSMPSFQLIQTKIIWADPISNESCVLRTKDELLSISWSLEHRSQIYYVILSKLHCTIHNNKEC